MITDVPYLKLTLWPIRMRDNIRKPHSCLCNTDLFYNECYGGLNHGVVFNELTHKARLQCSPNADKGRTS